MQSETRLRTHKGMGIYIPHREGTVQSIVLLSFAIYQGYANPPQVIVDRLEQFAGCADWARGRIADRNRDSGRGSTRLSIFAG